MKSREKLDFVKHLKLQNVKKGEKIFEAGEKKGEKIVFLMKGNLIID
jgi:hypothetical protein